MSAILELLARLAVWLLLAPLLPGIINKVKAWVAGRRGPPVLQLYYDLARLWRKGVVLSTLASPGFIAGPAVAWVAVLAAALLLPLGPLGDVAEFSRRRDSAGLPAGAGALLHGVGGAGNRFGLRRAWARRAKSATPCWRRRR